MMQLPAAFLDRPIAHRALHDKAMGRPENSLAAVRAAVEAGFGIEIDVQPSRDGVAMVFHDYDLERLTGTTGAIATLDATALRAIPLLGDDEGIPTLREVLETVAGKVPLLIEIKDQDGHMGPNLGPLGAAVARDLHGYQGPVAVMSFNPHAVAEMGRLAPNTPRGITTSAYIPDEWVPLPARICAHLRAIPDYEATGSCFISHEVTDLHRPRVAEIRALGAAILCWTVTSPELEAEARKAADNITFEGYLA
jgi:glycerophosphoryl diester phosphodiesterase